MGDRGIPRSWRHMNLYSGHTFMWVNAAGEKVWVRYHFITDQGIENLTQAEADALVSVDTDYHTRDLFEAIERGDYPRWTLKMQIMPFEDAKTYRFNPFDLTKVWPHGDYPLIEVGRLTLDRNPTDNHSQIEQGAWEPSNLVPGIGASPDKMLLGRMFAYADAQRYRIGANYNQLPVNAPKSPVHSYSTAGQMRYQIATDPVYSPNSKGGPHADTERYGEPAGWHTDGEMVRTAYTLRAEDDDWGQAGTLVRDVMNDAERDRLVDNIVGHLLNGVSEPVLQRAFEYWRNVDTRPRRPDREGRPAMSRDHRGSPNSRQPYRQRSHRVDSRHDDSVDLSPLTTGISVRQLAITLARYRARPRIAICRSAIPRHRAGTAVSGNHTAIRTRQRRRREVILDDERFLRRGGRHGLDSDRATHHTRGALQDGAGDRGDHRGGRDRCAGNATGLPDAG